MLGRKQNVCAFAILMASALICLANKGKPDGDWVVTSPNEVDCRFGGDPTKDDAEILNDGSVQMRLPAPRWSVTTLRFSFPKETRIRRVRVEILPDLRFADRRLGRNPERKELLLFDVSADRDGPQGRKQPLEWATCKISADAQDPSNTDGANLIDDQSDSGWAIPPLRPSQQSQDAVLAFREEQILSANGSLYLKFDVGGSPEYDTPARYRVAFSDH